MEKKNTYNPEVNKDLSRFVIEDLKLYETYDRSITQKLEEKLTEANIPHSFTDNAQSILAKRYFKKDEDGTPQEDVEGLFRRVAANIAYPDFHYSNGNEELTAGTAKKFYSMMVNREFLPNSPTLMNAGRSMQQLAACFVLPIEDNMESILQGVYDTGMIHKSGGGTGFSFSDLRRKNDFVSTTYGKSSGPVSFIEAYDAMTHSVNQGGFRRGANMGMNRTDHPDNLEFIHSKQNEKDQRYGNFNFSVAITDEFMEALKNDGHYILINPRKGNLFELTTKDLEQEVRSVEQGLISSNERNLILDGDRVIYQNPIERDIRGRITKVEKKKVGRVDDQGRITLHARTVFKEIAKLAWKNGEPGIAFVDRMNEYNPTLTLGDIKATNPCGEQPLLPYEACILGSINLGIMVKDGKIDYNKLEKITKEGTHFLDNAIDMSNYPLQKSKKDQKKLRSVLEKSLDNPELIDSIVSDYSKSPIGEMVRANRKIGLGVMGFADMLFKLNIQYGSEKSFKIAEDVMKFIRDKAVEQSEEMAKQRGAFPTFKESIYADKKPRRNATTTTIAPTGTISIIAGASSGVEPIFDVSYEHKDADGQKRIFKNKILEERLLKKGFDVEKVFREITDERDDKGVVITPGKKLQDLDYIPQDIKEIFITSEDISPKGHVMTQVAFQKYTDNAVSKTVNFPKGTEVKDVEEVYQLAYEEGCKGITVYVDGSREEQVLTKQRGGIEGKVEYIKPKKRPDELEGKTIKKKTGCGNIFVTRNYTIGKNETKDLFEIFAQIGKGGGCAASQNEGIGRLASYLLRSNADPTTIASQLIGIRCHKSIGFGANAIYSCADAIGKSIAEFYELKVKDEIKDSENFENLLSKKDKINKEIQNEIINGDPSVVGGGCSECGSPLQIKEGCIGGVCSSPTCAFSECG